MADFLKRLGAITAQEPQGTKVFKRASSIIRYEAIERAKKRDLERMADKGPLEEFLAQRKQHGSGRYQWWEEITRFVDNFQGYEIHQ